MNNKLRLGKAIGYGILIWLVGFIWGSIVFMTPSLKGISPIPYISKNPVISFPILLMWIFLTLFLAKRCLKSVTDGVSEGLKLGMIFVVINLLLDLLVLVFLLKTGLEYFGSLMVWIAYTILLIIPIFVERSLKK